MEREIPVENTQEKSIERVPAPVVEVGEPPKKRKKFPWWKALIAVGLSVILFLSGYVFCYATLDDELYTLLSVKKRIQEEYYKEVTDEEFYSAVFGGINEKLLDDYSCYMTPSEYAEAIRDLEGNRSGVGLIFTTGNGDELRITRVCGNSPAEEAGLLAGDRILACGGTETELTEYSTFDEFSKFLEGYGEGEDFYIKIQSGGAERVVKINKQQYVENYVFYRTKDTAYTFTGTNASVWTEKGEAMPYLDGDTAYIRLIQFTGNAAQEFAKAMAHFKEEGKKNLVLDLRGNGGGFLDTMQSIASYFCKTATEKKPVVATAVYNDGKREEYRAPSNQYYDYFAEDSNIYVLADNGSASASECLIGCMLDYGAMPYENICLAERLNAKNEKEAKTFGKGIMQVTYLMDLIKQDALKLTTAEIRWPVSDRSIHDRGVLPKDGARTVEENIDFEEETQAAIEILLSK